MIQEQPFFQPTPYPTTPSRAPLRIMRDPRSSYWLLMVITFLGYDEAVAIIRKQPFF